jgi:hypothetical protein
MGSGMCDRSQRTGRSARPIPKRLRSERGALHVRFMPTADTANSFDHVVGAAEQ